MIDALDMTTITGLAQRRVGSPGSITGASFDGSLAAARGARDRATAREAAEQLVSSAFIQPVLDIMRESLTADGPFKPGFAEKQFAPLLDQRFADAIVRSANFPVVDAIVDRLLGPAGGAS